MFTGINHINVHIIHIGIDIEPDRTLRYTFNTMTNGIFQQWLKDQRRNLNLIKVFLNVFLHLKTLSETHGHNVKKSIPAMKFIGKPNQPVIVSVHAGIQHRSQGLNHFTGLDISVHTCLPVHHFQRIIEEMGIDLCLQCLNLSILCGNLFQIYRVYQMLDLYRHGIKGLCQPFKFFIRHLVITNCGAKFSIHDPVCHIRQFPQRRLYLDCEKIVGQCHKGNHAKQENIQYGIQAIDLFIKDALIKSVMKIQGIIVTFVLIVVIKALTGRVFLRPCHGEVFLFSIYGNPEIRRIFHR